MAPKRCVTTDVPRQERQSEAMPFTPQAPEATCLRTHCASIPPLVRIDEPPGGRVISFSGATGSSYGVDTFNGRSVSCFSVKRLAARAGIGIPVSPHWLRHSNDGSNIPNCLKFLQCKIVTNAIMASREREMDLEKKLPNPSVFLRFYFRRANCLPAMGIRRL